MRLVADMIAASTPPTLLCGGLCGGLWYFKKREAAQIIAFQTVANAFACLAQFWLMKRAGHLQLAELGVDEYCENGVVYTFINNDRYSRATVKGLRATINVGIVSGVLLALAAQAVKSKRTISAKQLGLPIVAMSVLSFLASQSSAQASHEKKAERAFSWEQNLSAIAMIGIICYRRWGFR